MEAKSKLSLISSKQVIYLFHPEQGAEWTKKYPLVKNDKICWVTTKIITMQTLTL